MKDFDKWNKKKKYIDNVDIQYVSIKEGEIWWCSLGLNIGDEENGKHYDFERPVLILKKFNNRMCVVLLLSSQMGNPRFYYKINYDNKTSHVILSQIRLISVKRFKRVVTTLSYGQFKGVKKSLFIILK